MVPSMMMDLSTASLSLIEFIYVDDFDDFSFIGKQDRFSIGRKLWFFFVQNNEEPRTKRRSSFEKSIIWRNISFGKIRRRELLNYILWMQKNSFLCLIMLCSITIVKGKRVLMRFQPMLEITGELVAK
jgi:hypothetical protein